MTTTETIDIAKKQRELIQESLKSNNRKVEIFLKEKGVLEAFIRKCYSEMVSKSNLFELVEVEKQQTFDAYVNKLDSDGSFNYSERFKIDSVIAKYKDLDIKVKTNLLPKNHSNVRVIVEEKSNKYGRFQNWAIKISVDYSDSPSYRTGSSIVKYLNDKISHWNLLLDLNEKKERWKNKVETYMKTNYPVSLKQSDSKGTEFYLIRINENVSVSVKAVEFNDEVKLVLHNTHLNNNIPVEKFMEILKSI